MKPQSKTVLQALLRSPLTTGAVRERCGVSSVAAVIYELRELGCPIETQLVRVPTRHGRANVALYRIPRQAIPKARRLLKEAA